tara:strand:+ start:539 stop:898 length:360 start_codon:yes stop_codon:yes gene_type:complete
MTFKLKKYDSKRYDDEIYNCLHFAVDAYHDISGHDMGLYVSELMTGRDKRRVIVRKLKEFKPIINPINTCLAVMHGAELHIGIYHDGKIIHFNEQGVQAQPPYIAEINHGRIKYYAISH